MPSPKMPNDRRHRASQKLKRRLGLPGGADISRSAGLDTDRASARTTRPQRVRTGITEMSSADAQLYIDHLFRLAPDDRRLRFAHPVSDAVVERSVIRIDWARTQLLAWIVDGVPRAFVHLAWPESDWMEGDAELAVSVESAWQNQGVGSRLVDEALKVARREGLPGIRLFALAENAGVRALMGRFRARVSRSGCEIEGRIDLSVAFERFSRRPRRRADDSPLQAAVDRIDFSPQFG